MGSSLSFKHGNQRSSVIGTHTACPCPLPFAEASVIQVPPERVAAEQATQAVAQFNHEAFLQEDVTHLHRAYGLSEAFPLIHVHGPRGKVDNTATGGEGSLDLQTITSLAEAKTTWWAVDPLAMDGFMLAYATDVNDHPEPPLVHSISWGDAEALYPPMFIQRLDYELMKLALRLGACGHLQFPPFPLKPSYLAWGNSDLLLSSVCFEIV